MPQELCLMDRAKGTLGKTLLHNLQTSQQRNDKSITTGGCDLFILKPQSNCIDSRGKVDSSQFSGIALAQTPGTGAISGLVLDPASHVVSGVEVTAVNEATGISRSVTTTPEGVFRVPLLPPGSYAVTVKESGFAVNTSRSIPVVVSETTSLNVTLAIATKRRSALYRCQTGITPRSWGYPRVSS
jgi:hypothetical protein